METKHRVKRKLVTLNKTFIRAEKRALADQAVFFPLCVSASEPLDSKISVVR